LPRDVTACAAAASAKPSSAGSATDRRPELVETLLVHADDRLKPLHLNRRREFGLAAGHDKDVNIPRESLAEGAQFDLLHDPCTAGHP
jgi:hypothetical protein